MVRPFSGFSEKRDEVIGKITKRFLSRTRDEWLEILHEADTCVAPVHTSMDEVVDDPQFKHRRMMVEVDDPVLGKVKQPGIAIKLSDTPGKIRTLAPRHGEHTEEILLNLGFGPEEIKELKNKGCVM